MRVWSRNRLMLVVVSLLTLAVVPNLVWAQPNTPKASWGVRVGEHPTYTRVVFDLPTQLPYLFTRGCEATILLEFFQGFLLPTERLISVSRGVVREVFVVPSATETTAEIRLSGPAPIRSHFTLRNPLRVVVDFAHGQPE